MKVITSKFLRTTCETSAVKETIAQLPELKKKIESGEYEKGYRDGVILVDADPTNYNSTIVKLESGDEIIGEVKPRVDGEAPRISQLVLVDKDRVMPCKKVSIVFYHSKVLLETEKRDDEIRVLNSCDWNAITILTSIYDCIPPMQYDTMLHNHFNHTHEGGGTKTGWSAETLETNLKESFKFWSTHMRYKLKEDK